MDRVNEWTNRRLSKGRNEVLIKSFLLALPTYVMSSFLLALEICEKLASAIVQFWCSSNPPKKGNYWAKWENISLPRDSVVPRFLEAQGELKKKNTWYCFLKIVLFKVELYKIFFFEKTYIYIYNTKKFWFIT